jgi:hypothetical protein
VYQQVLNFVSNYITFETKCKAGRIAAQALQRPGLMASSQTVLWPVEIDALPAAQTTVLCHGVHLAMLC